MSWVSGEVPPACDSDCAAGWQRWIGYAFEERLKIHDVVLEGIDLALRRHGYAPIERLRAGKKR
jgi:hypothetical protein